MAINNSAPRSFLRREDLLKALPSEVSEKKHENNLTSLVTQISMKTVPAGYLTRMWLLGSLQTKIALGYLAYAMKRSFVNETEKQRLLNETNLTAALRLFGTMGYLRGAIMKLGQMLGNLPEVMPKEFIDVLGSLHFEAPPMHYSMVREVLLDELGKEPQELFASFETTAFAAASFGQVHRAQLKNGREVAVKIQYPNIARTIRSDMRILRTLLSPMRFKGEWRYLKNHLVDLEEMLNIEVDYREEARFMQQAYQLFEDFQRIVVPRYHAEFSSPRVLTMDYLPGKHLQPFMDDNPSQQQRNNFGELISIAITRLSLHSKLYYTDTHPGNFLMMADGRLGFLDFGNHRALTAQEWQLCMDGESAVFITRDDTLLEDVVARGCLYGNTDEMDQELVALLIKIAQWQGEPALHDAVFDFGNKDWFKRGMDLWMNVSKRGQSRYQPLWNWYNRLIWGHRILMHRLDCKINFRRLYLEHSPLLAKVP